MCLLLVKIGANSRFLEKVHNSKSERRMKIKRKKRKKNTPTSCDRTLNANHLSILFNFEYVARIQSNDRTCLS